jgi:hypothetical protein
LEDGETAILTEPSKMLMGDVHQKQVKAVCMKCNNGWMNDIVQAAIPIVTSVVLKKNVSINRQDQKRLATWLALQALMADLLAKQPLKLPRKDLDYLYLHKEPPPELFIGIGSYLGPMFVAFNHNSLPIWAEDENGNRVRQISIHVLSTIIGGLYAINHRSDPFLYTSPADIYRPYIVQIWPTFHNVIAWPAPYNIQVVGRFNQKGSIARVLATDAGRLITEEFETRGFPVPKYTL